MRTLLRQTLCALTLVALVTGSGCGPDQEPAATSPAQPVFEVPTAEPASTDAFFSEWPVVHLEIEVDEAGLRASGEEADDYARGVVKEGARAWKDVAIRWRRAGGAESGEWVAKPSLSLDFGLFHPGQTYHGVDVVELNNAAEDERYMAQHLANQLFHEANVPAPRVTHAAVSLNGEVKGLYVLLEGAGRSFLSQWFQDPDGEFYEVSEPADVDEAMIPIRGDVEDGETELRTLAEAAREPDPGRRLERLRSVLDMDRFLSFMAVEVLVARREGYCLSAGGYRLYRDPGSAKFVFLPGDLHGLFAVPELPPIPVFRGLVADAVMGIPAVRDQYLARVATLRTNLFQVDRLTKQLESLQLRVRPVLEALAPTEVEDHDVGVEALRLAMIRRVRTVELLIETPETNPVWFGAGGAVNLTGWVPETHLGTNSLDVVTNATGVSLRIEAGGAQAIASWRTNVFLGSGQYRLEGRVRGRGVSPVQADARFGVSLRSSVDGSAGVRRLAGDFDWTLLSDEFEVEAGPQGAEVELLAELYAEEGEVWFDLGSLRLIRLSGGRSGAP